MNGRLEILGRLRLRRHSCIEIHLVAFELRKAAILVVLQRIQIVRRVRRLDKCLQNCMHCRRAIHGNDADLGQIFAVFGDQVVVILVLQIIALQLVNERLYKNSAFRQRERTFLQRGPAVHDRDATKAGLAALGRLHRPENVATENGNHGVTAVLLVVSGAGGITGDESTAGLTEALHGVCHHEGVGQILRVFRVFRERIHIDVLPEDLPGLRVVAGNDPDDVISGGPENAGKIPVLLPGFKPRESVALLLELRLHEGDLLAGPSRGPITRCIKHCMSPCC